MKDIKLTNIFSQAWKVFKNNWKIIILALFVFILVSGLLSSLEHFLSGENGIFNFLLSLVSYLVSVWLGMGFIKFNLNVVDGKKPCVKDLFTGVQSFKHLLKYFVITLLAGILIMFGYILLIIPGLILTFGLYFIGFVAYENKHGIRESISYAWKLTKGYKWDLFLFALLSMLISLAGLIAFGVGLLVAIPVCALATAIFYRKLQVIYAGAEVTVDGVEETEEVKEEQE